MPERWLSGTAMALDYYDILGVPPRADAGEIKKAYRVLALQWHPDKNPGDPWATSRFLRLGEAYRVLKDPVSRAAYDWLWSQEKQRGELFPPYSRQNRRKASAAPHSFTSRRPPRSPAQGRHPLRGINRFRERRRQRPSPFLHTEEVHGSSGGLFPWLLSLKTLPQRLLNWLAGRPPADLEWEMVPAPDQPDLIMDLRVPRWLAVQGARVNFLIRTNNQGRCVQLAIPPGVKDGVCMRVKGGGGIAGAGRGHLYINIRLKD